MLLETKSMSVDHIISGIYDSRIENVILIGDSTILLDYEHWVMRSLHVVNGRLQT